MGSTWPKDRIPSFANRPPRLSRSRVAFIPRLAPSAAASGGAGHNPDRGRPPRTNPGVHHGLVARRGPATGRGARATLRQGASSSALMPASSIIAQTEALAI